MEKFVIQALGRGLKHEFKPPKDLPFPLRKALEALAKLHPDQEGDGPLNSPPKPPSGK